MGSNDSLVQMVVSGPLGKGSLGPEVEPSSPHLQPKHANRQALLEYKRREQFPFLGRPER